MQIHNGIHTFNQIKNSVLTIGTFDGVHLGHQALLSTINQKAKAIHGESILLTFHPHPRTVIRKHGETIKLLTPIKEKIKKLESIGIQHLIIQPFSLDFANQQAEEYVKEVLIDGIGPKQIIIGYDHQFGKNREGDIELLKKIGQEHDFIVDQIGKKEIDDITYSSTNIRTYLSEGKVDKAAQLLGYHYEIEGIVVHGHKRGRDIGYPTANIQVDDLDKLIPSKGVYAVITEYNNKRYKGMLNIGTRPTFDGKLKTIENVLFDFNGDLYGHKIKTKFIMPIRPEYKFNSVDELKSQLILDELKARDILKDF